MDNKSKKNSLLLASKLDDLLVKGITDAAAEQQLAKCKEALANAQNISVCSIRARKPAIRITLDKYYGNDDEEIANFRKKAESSRNLTAFTDYLKKLDSIEKACREKLYGKCIMSKGDSHIISKDDFQDFTLDDFGDYKKKWDDTLDSIRNIFDVEILAFKNRVTRIINETPYAEETKDRLNYRLARVCSIDVDTYVSKITLELDSEFAPETFSDETMIKTVSVAALNRTRRDMAEIIGGLIRLAYEGTCMYLLQVGTTEKDTTWGLAKSKEKYKTCRERLISGNVLEFEPISSIAEQIDEIVKIEDTFDARLALIELLSSIWALGNKYELDLEVKKLPNADGITITPELLEEGVI